MTISPPPPYRGKRIFDLGILAILAIPALVVGIVCAAAVRLTSRGPVLFRQPRVGRNGAQFDCLKLRTMVHDPHRVGGLPSAELVTPVGRVLRRWSLDELPQLWNVVVGDMSIVGPRPTLDYQVDRYTPEQRRRLTVRPGLTGLAQVSGRTSMRWAERIELDIAYVESPSLRNDVLIVLRTPWVIMRGGTDAHDVDDPIAVPPATSEAGSVNAHRAR